MEDAITGELCMWTVFAHPLDYPLGYVARMFVGARPTRTAIYGATLKEVRELLSLTYPGLYCVPRSPVDHPSVVETWL
ncbi:hypothetical protein [Burkholderia pseudomallei]|uniref:hypothetical protein n=1 Tax=Burkholderia pseudomallei TaxID=28450 RepID=UPI00190D1F14|nr:hypothetical protein [Burkholderia pseudomallei]MBK3333533.1 hypothetical protein [Burkholderia pseudomallei]